MSEEYSASSQNKAALEEQFWFLVESVKDYLEASNGVEALQICENYSKRVELLITDILMPQLNGQELASRLRKLRPELKVLYISGYTDELNLAEETHQNGFDFLQKPFTTNKLIHTVQQLLD